MFFFSVSYKVAEDEWIFFLSVMDFFLCTIVFIRSVVWVIRGVTFNLPVYGRIFSCLLWTFFCHSHLGICASLQYVQSSWCAMCC